MATAIKPIKGRKFNYGERVPYDTGLNKTIELMEQYLEKISLYFFGGQQRVTIFQGLQCAWTSGKTVQISDGLAAVPNDFLNDSSLLHFGAHFQESVTVDDGDPAFDRIDLIQGRYRARADQTENVTIYSNATPSPTNVNSLVRVFHEIEIVLKKGTPAAIPVPPSKDTGFNAFITGTRDWAANPTIDLAAKYMIRVQFDDETAAEIDLRGAVPTATTLAEIVAKINGVFTGLPVVASGAGNLLTLSAREANTAGVLRLTTPSVSPQGANIDATDQVFGQYHNSLPFAAPLSHINSASYEILCMGRDDCFPLAEVKILANETVLNATRVRDVYQKSLWIDTANADLIDANYVGYIDHRSNPDMDHPDGSVHINHLDNALQNNIILQRFSKYRKKRVVDTGLLDANNNKKLSFTIADVVLRNATGALAHDKFAGNYPTLSAVPKFVAGQFTFNHVVNISVPSAYNPVSASSVFQILTDPDFLGRVNFDLMQLVVYADSIGASPNDLFVKITKVSDNTQILETQIPVAGLTDGEYIVIPLPISQIDIGVDYRIQFKQTAPTIVLTGPAPSVLNHRVYMRPEGGQYQNHPSVTDGMSVYVWDRETETVVKQLKGYAADYSGANYDAATQDLVPYADPEIAAGAGHDYAWAGIDSLLGKVKVPKELFTNDIDPFPERELRCDFNAKILYNDLDNDNLPTDSLPTGNKGLQTFIDDYLYSFIPYLLEVNVGTFDFTRHNIQRVTTVAASLTLTLTNTKRGAIYVMLVRNTGGGACTLTYPANFKWPENISVPSVNSGKILMITVLYDGTDYFVTSSGEYVA